MALVNQTETRNWSAISATNISGGTAEPIMYMNAAYNGRELNFSKNIQNIELYKTNQEMVDADYDEFQNYVLTEMGE